MKNKMIVRTLSLLLTLCLFATLISCSTSNNNNLGDERNSTALANPENGKNPNAPFDPTVPYTLDLTWHRGYIGASDHKTSPWKISENVNYYSYTDVFCIEKAGTTIVLFDDNSNCGGNQGVAAADVLVLSTWKQVNGEWVIDKYGASYTGFSEIALVQKNKIAYTYTTTNYNECLRLCYHSGETADFKPEVYASVGAQLTRDRGTAKKYLSDIQWIKESSEVTYHNALEGLTMNLIGDSYLDPNAKEDNWPEYMWPDFFQQKYFMKITNHGKSGSTVSNLVNQNPMCNRYMNLPSNNPDIVVVEGGRNDYNNAVSIGDVNSKDCKTYSGALNTIIDGLQEKYPNAMIVCISPWNFPNTNTSTSLTYRDYVNGMKAVAEKQGVYFINASDPAVSGVNMSDPSFAAQYTIKPGDISHLNQNGMKLVFPNFEKAIAECYHDFLRRGHETKNY